VLSCDYNVKTSTGKDTHVARIIIHITFEFCNDAKKSSEVALIY